jgi:rubrerythrin
MADEQKITVTIDKELVELSKKQSETIELQDNEIARLNERIEELESSNECGIKNCIELKNQMTEEIARLNKIIKDLKYDNETLRGNEKLANGYYDICKKCGYAWCKYCVGWFCPKCGNNKVLNKEDSC